MAGNDLGTVALAAVRQRSAETGTPGPVTPSQPTIINAEPGQISAHLHPT